MKSSKTKKIIVFILRILPLVPIFVYLLSVFRTGVYDSADLAGGIGELAHDLEGAIDFEPIDSIVFWCLNHLCPFYNGVGYACISVALYVGLYNVMISMFLLLYNVFTWFINIGNSVIERSFLNEK